MKTDDDETVFPAVLCAALLCGCTTLHDCVARRNVDMILRYLEEWANRGDAAVADQLIAMNLVLRNPPGAVQSGAFAITVRGEKIAHMVWKPPPT